MGVMESVSAVRWARHRQPDEIAYGIVDPAQVGELGQGVSDRKYKLMAVLSADPDAHLRQVKLRTA